MGQGYTRQSAAEIADGNVITDVDLEKEFDAIAAFAHGTLGHTHDGTTGEGPKIDLTTSITGILPVVNGGSGGINNFSASTDPTINEDANDGYVVGSRWVNTTTDLYFVCVDSTIGAAIWARYQPYDVDLAAIAALASAANKLPYATGAGTWALTDLSTYGRTLIDDADAPTARTTLGLVIGTDVQAYNANLASLSAVSGAANKGIQFTAANTIATYDLTAAGRALLDDASASDQLDTLGFSAYIKTLIPAANATAARSTLGLTIGGDVQPYSANLNAWAGYNANGILVQTSVGNWSSRTITGTANEVTVTNGNGISANPTLSLPSALTFTGKTITGGTYSSITASGSFSGTWSGAFSSASATITGGTITGITDLAVADGGTGASDAAGARTNLGLVIGTDIQAYDAATVKYGTAGTFTKPQRGSIVTLTDGATVTPDFNDANKFQLTLGGNRTLANPSNIGSAIGQSIIIYIFQDGTGNRTLSYGSQWKFPDGVAPSLSTTAGRCDVLVGEVVANNFIVCNIVGSYS